MKDWGVALDHPQLGTSSKNKDYTMAKAHTGQPSPRRHVDSEVIATRLWFVEQHENAFESFTRLQQTGGDSLACTLHLSHRERGPTFSVP